VQLTLDVVFRVGRVHVFTCLWSGAGVFGGFGAWCLVNKASGRLAGMRGPKGPATRLKRDVRPVLGVMSDGRRVCVRDGRQHLDMCVLPRKYCLAQAVYVWETEKGELHSSQQKSPPPDSLVTFKGRCPAAA
jgi:hypothetical protein